MMKPCEETLGTILTHDMTNVNIIKRIAGRGTACALKPNGDTARKSCGQFYRQTRFRDAFENVKKLAGYLLTNVKTYDNLCSQANSMTNAKGRNELRSYRLHETRRGDLTGCIGPVEHNKKEDNPG